MSNLINFVRGVNLSNSSYSEKNPFPKDEIKRFKNLQWLNIDHNGIESVPAVLSHLRNLEHLSVENNQLFHIPSSVGLLDSLRAIKVGKNELTEDELSIPSGMFKLKDLSTIDLSHNKLGTIPDAIRSSDGLIVLDVGHNRVESSSGAPLPSTLFISCSELRYLDLSFNKIEVIPPPLRKLKNLTTLSLAGNSLGTSSMRPLLALEELNTLNLSNTGRETHLFPEEFDSTSFPNLKELDLSKNKLEIIPNGILMMSSLERLDISDNRIAEMALNAWSNLITLNASRNELKEIPGHIGSLITLQSFYVNHNNIEELPREISQLVHLQELRAAGNKLSAIPAVILEQCISLRTLKLHDNALNTLPAQIYNLHELSILTTGGNASFKMPAKPIQCVEDRVAQIMANFSVDNDQIDLDEEKSDKRSLLGLNNNSMGPIRATSPQKLARPDIGKGFLHDVVAKSTERTNIDDNRAATLEDLMSQMAKPKEIRNWSNTMFGENIDYSDLFDIDTGRTSGVSLWRIEQFSPVRQSETNQLATGDCYIALSTRCIPKGGDTVDVHEIYFWLGKEASQDKKACAAINAIQLRDFLQVGAVIRREEEGEETEGFLSMFDGFIVTQGGTDSGFYEIDITEHIERLYVLTDSRNGICVDAVPFSKNMLQSDRMVLMDTTDTLYLWRGKEVKLVDFCHARLLVERILQGPNADGQNLSQIIDIDEDGCACPEFERRFTVAEIKYELPKAKSRIFEVKLGHGFLELPQISTRHRSRHTSDLLKSDSVYIIDAHADIFVWFGERSSKLLQTAAERLAAEIEKTTGRPEHIMVTYFREGAESVVFKTNFTGWNDVIHPDHRLLGSYNNTDIVPSLPEIVDLKDLFSPVCPVMSEEEANELDEQWKDDLEKCDAYVLQNGNFVRLQKGDFGVFHSENCYVFLCKEWHIVPGGDLDSTDDPLEESGCTAFFWQGRDAGLMGWLIFQHSFVNEIAPLIARQFDNPKLRVVKEYQHRESMRFMALFDKKMIVQRGHYADTKLAQATQLFHIHSWQPEMYTRAIEVDCISHSLDPNGCFILKIPPKIDGSLSGHVYLWIGSQVDESDKKIASSYPFADLWKGYTVSTIIDGNTDNQFNQVLSQPLFEYDKTFIGIRDTRVFECSCFNGFTVKEMMQQVTCQDSLDEHLVYIVISKGKIFIWRGSYSLEILNIWSHAAAKEYVKRSVAQLSKKDFIRDAFKDLKLTPPDLVDITPGKEPLEFTRLFHGWGRNIRRTIDLSRPVEKVENLLDPLPPLPPVHERYEDAPFYIHLRKTIAGKSEPHLQNVEIQESENIRGPTPEIASPNLRRAPTPDEEVIASLNEVRYRISPSSPSTPGLNSSRLSSRLSGGSRISRRRSRLSMTETDHSNVLDDFDVAEYERRMMKLAEGHDDVTA